MLQAQSKRFDVFSTLGLALLTLRSGNRQGRDGGRWLELRILWDLRMSNAERQECQSYDHYTS